MMENLEHIDRNFKEKFDSLSESPAPSVWDNIADRLGHKKKRSAIFFIYRIAAGMALLLSLSIALAYLSGYKETMADKNNPMPSSGNVGETKNASVLPSDHKRNTAETDKPDMTVQEPVYEKRSARDIQNVHDENIAVISGTPAMENQFTQAPDNLGITNLEKLHGIYPAELDDHREIPGMKSGISRTPILRENPLQTLPENQMIAEETVSGNDRSRWQMGGEFGPLYSGRIMTSDYLATESLDQLNSQDNAVLSYAGGLNIRFNASGRLSIQSGVAYSRYGQEKTGLISTGYEAALFNNYPEIASVDQVAEERVYVMNATGNYTNQGSSAANNYIEFFNAGTVERASNIIYANPADMLESVSEYYEYMEIPVVVRYKIIDRKIDFSVMGGGSANILVNTSLFENYDNNSNYDGKITNIRKFNYCSILGIGLEYPLGKDFNLAIEPKFNYYLNAVDKNDKINIHPYSFGFLTGINYRF